MVTRTITIQGKPFAKERPRFARGHVFTPQKTLNYEGRVANLYQTKYPNATPFKGMILAYMFIYFPIPKSASKKLKAAMLANEILPQKKKDIDNIAKILCDGLNMIAYHDDSQIVEMHCYKRYSETPRTVIILKEL